MPGGGVQRGQDGAVLGQGGVDNGAGGWQQKIYILIFIGSLVEFVVVVPRSYVYLRSKVTLRGFFGEYPTGSKIQEFFFFAPPSPYSPKSLNCTPRQTLDMRL